MSSELPIVFLAFANQADDHLAMLKDESRDIFEALQPLEREGQIAIHREESSEFDELYQDLLSYDDRIVIFHYGGHADGASLELEDGTGGAGGIAGLLGQQSSLKLVFLNGCATQDQVRLLHAAGVPAVIATSVRINDNKATQFSTAFYSALVEGRYELKTPWRNGTTHVIFETLDFISRLVSLVPKPRANLTRFHGVFAPNSKYRSKVTPARRGERKKSHSTDEANQTPAEKRASMTWAKRLKRVFSIDITACDKCGGEVRIIASIEDPVVIVKILTHLEGKTSSEVTALLPECRAPPLAKLLEGL